jgi:LAGLIDADG DNA endonuclease family
MQKKSINPCFSFKQSVKHIDYLFYIFFIFLHWGYTQSHSIPLIKYTKDSKGNKHKYVRFRTITSSNLLNIYNMFYK